MKTIKKIFVYSALVAVLVAIVFGMYYGNDIASKFRTVEYVSPRATSTTAQVVDASSDVEKARKQLQEATDKLNTEEAKILAETERASSTAHAEVAKIMAEYEAVKATNDQKLDEINEIRGSF